MPINAAEIQSKLDCQPSLMLLDQVVVLDKDKQIIAQKKNKQILSRKKFFPFIMSIFVYNFHRHFYAYKIYIFPVTVRPFQKLRNHSIGRFHPKSIIKECQCKFAR